MNNQEAKFILGGYRPGGHDAGDAMFCEALKQAQADPVLGAWFAREQAHDAAVAAKLREIAPPAGLREAILAGARVSGTKPAAWRRPVWMAMAASVAVLIGVTAALWPNRAAATAPLTKFAMADALEISKHGGRGAAERELRGDLTEASTRLSGRLPVDFAALAKTGCRTVDVDGQTVLEVCFKRDGTWFHCYIARCGDFPALAAKQGPVFAENGKISAVTWADGAHRFVVAGPAGRETIARLL